MPRVMKFRQRNSHILRRIQNIEDVQEISFLKAAYCAGCDDDHNGDTVAALFVPAGVWATSMSGEHHGHDAIRAFFRSVRDSKRGHYCFWRHCKCVVEFHHDVHITRGKKISHFGFLSRYVCTHIIWLAFCISVFRCAGLRNFRNSDF